MLPCKRAVTACLAFLYCLSSLFGARCSSLLAGHTVLSLLSGVGQAHYARTTSAGCTAQPFAFSRVLELVSHLALWPISR
eukprot:76339-Pleurochrysis_carterae.AAC.4